MTMTSTRSFTIRRTTAAIPMVEARTIKAMRTGYEPAPTMRGAARTMIRNARTSTGKPWAALTRSLDSAPIISRHTATASCAGTMKGFGIGRDTSAAALSIRDPDSRSRLLLFSRDRLGRGSLFYAGVVHQGSLLHIRLFPYEIVPKASLHIAICKDFYSQRYSANSA